MHPVVVDDICRHNNVIISKIGEVVGTDVFFSSLMLCLYLYNKSQTFLVMSAYGTYMCSWPEIIARRRASS